MKILVLAPQPFFQERGTPIAVRMLLEVLAEKYAERPESSSIELLTYHEGTPTELIGITQHRIRAPRWLRNIKPGISVKKLVADWFFFWRTLGLIWSNRRDQFTLIHAIEESVFIAWLCKQCFGIPYVYDMDSSLSLQLTESWKPLRIFLPLFEKLESMAISDSLAVVPVCDSLAETAAKHGAQNIKLLTDVSTFNILPTDGSQLRTELQIDPSHLLVLYVGNLQPYQGVQVLVDSFVEELQRELLPAQLVIIGGSTGEVEKLKKRVARRSPSDAIKERISILGARPLDRLPNYLSEADILVSPRTEGNNTPMKIYNYMISGKPILATNILSHTQVLTPDVALLCEPTVTSMGSGLNTLITNEQLRARLGYSAQTLAKQKYTVESFKRNVLEIYGSLEQVAL
jgi:glycosyltransferase involved in cell wall biosynthesis